MYFNPSDTIFIHLLFKLNRITHGYSWYSLTCTDDFFTGTDDLLHGYCISSRVLMVCLTGIDFFHGLLNILAGNADITHGYG